MKGLKSTLLVGLTLGLVFSAAACTSAKRSYEEKEEETITIEVNGKEVAYSKIPKRAVALNYENAQVLIALGLKNHIAAVTSAHFKLEECLPEYQDELKNLKLLGKDASFEAIMAENPDFVYGHSMSFRADRAGAPEDFEANHTPYYMVKGDTLPTATFEAFYEDILNLGQIFGVPERAKELVIDMKRREEAVKAEAVENSPSVFLYDSGDKQATTAGHGALQSRMLETVGAKNIFDDIEDKYKKVSWEEVAARNPQWILINEYEDENLTMTKKEFLKSNPALENCDAVKNNHFISINLIELREGLQCIDGLEKILTALKAG